MTHSIRNYCFVAACLIYSMHATETGNVLQSLIIILMQLGTFNETLTLGRFFVYRFKLPDHCKNTVKCSIVSSTGAALDPTNVKQFPCLRYVKDLSNNNTRLMTYYDTINADIDENRLRKVETRNHTYYRQHTQFERYAAMDANLPRSPTKKQHAAKLVVHETLEVCLTRHCNSGGSLVVLRCRDRVIKSLAFNLTKWVTDKCIERIEFVDFRGSVLKRGESREHTCQTGCLTRVIGIDIGNGSLDSYGLLAALAPHLVYLRLSSVYEIHFLVNLTLTLPRLLEIRTPLRTYWRSNLFEFEIFDHVEHVTRTIRFDRPDQPSEPDGLCEMQRANKTPRLDRMFNEKNLMVYNYFLLMVLTLTVTIFITVCKLTADRSVLFSGESELSDFNYF